jgi:hypothetical protein
MISTLLPCRLANFVEPSLHCLVACVECLNPSAHRPVRRQSSRCVQ